MTRLTLPCSYYGSPSLKEAPKFKLRNTQHFMVHVFGLKDHPGCSGEFSITYSGQGSEALRQVRYCLRKIAQATYFNSSSMARVLVSIKAVDADGQQCSGWTDYEMRGDLALAWLAWAPKPKSLNLVGPVLKSLARG